MLSQWAAVALIHQLLAAQEPALHKLGMLGRGLLRPLAVVLRVPVARLLDGGEPLRHHHALSYVELLRIEPVPPFPFALRLSEEPKIGRAEERRVGTPPRSPMF